ncbi:ADP-ribosylglycohydrolase family protein [Metabacillus idriensis]|uniref:ADP-ribosylglycohydrolase family protein n=1 Tax=Metabacillus idriensis TaxID=324768 RepID=UPI00174CB644|nr:ADP-ribosylglycohydrolase family protein [Metabacillus idriensis]
MLGKIEGVLYGGAIGDAMGSPTEGLTPEMIMSKFGTVTTFREPASDAWKEPGNMRPLEKGNGHITDDTLMVEAMLKVYAKKQRHLTAYDIAEALVEEIAEKNVYIPELRKEAPVISRLYYPEQYLFLRHRLANVDPREAGQGNMVNCGAAMYMSPVGIMNAGDPERAYQEAIDIAGAHQTSYGREAAGIMAAAVAEALSKDATVQSILSVARSLAKDGTKLAIESVLDAAAVHLEWETAREDLRKAMEPFDTVKNFSDRKKTGKGNANTPSRIHSIEELPIALAMFSIAGGDTMKTIIGGVNYGHDADSIASMGGAIAGALNGELSLPNEFKKEVDFVNKRSFKALSQVAYTTMALILKNDKVKFESRINRIDF